MKSISEWKKETYKLAKEKGWHEEGNEKTFGECIALVHAELSEALEEYRKGKGFDETYYSWGEGTSPSKPEGINIEMADVVIRVFDICEQFGIDLEEAMEKKHEYNKTRSYRHGNKKI